MRSTDNFSGLTKSPFSSRVRSGQISSDSGSFGFGFIGFLDLRIWIYRILEPQDLDLFIGFGPADLHLDSKSLPGLTERWPGRRWWPRSIPSRERCSEHGSGEREQEV